MGDASVARHANVQRTPIWCARLSPLLAMPAGMETPGQTIGYNALTDMDGVNADASGPASPVAEKLAAGHAAASLSAIAIEVIAAGASKDAGDDDKLVRRIAGESAVCPLFEGDCPIAS